MPKSGWYQVFKSEFTTWDYFSVGGGLQADLATLLWTLQLRVLERDPSNDYLFQSTVTKNGDFFA
jgi:hypothetical protein